MSFSDTFPPSSFSYDPNGNVESSNINESNAPADSMQIEANLSHGTPTEQTQFERPGGSLKRKPEAEPPVEPQQQPNKKFKFSLGASGAAPQVPSTPVAALSRASTTPAPIDSSTTGSTSSAVPSTDAAAAARETLLKELASLDTQLLELDKQMTAPAPIRTSSASVPLSHHTPRQQRPSSKRTYAEGGELLEDFRPVARPPVRTQPPMVGAPLTPTPPKRKPFDPVLPPSPWTRGSRALATSVESNEAKAWEEAKALWRDMHAHQWAWPFKEPVDPLKLGVPDYFNVVKNPMDLSTVKQKFTKKLYANVQDYVTDMRLIWSNCMAFNAPLTDVHKMAESLSAIFETRVPKIFDLVRANPREDLRKARDTLSTLITQRHLMEEEEARMREEVVKAQEVPQSAFTIPGLVENFALLSFEEKQRLSNNVNNLNELQNVGLIELIKQSRPELVHSGSITLDLNIDDLDGALFRRMELYIEQNGLVSTQSIPKVEAAAPVPLIDLAEEFVKNESMDVEENKHVSESSSSSDDEVPFVAPTRAGPAPTPSSDIPEMAHFNQHQQAAGKMPKIIEAGKHDYQGGDIQVEASWGNLVPFRLLEIGVSTEEENRDVPAANDEVNPLWSEFKNRTAQLAQIEKEKEEREQALKAAQLQQLQDQRRVAFEAEARAREEVARKEREREEEIARKREEARQQREQLAPQVDLLEQSNIMKEFQQSLNKH